MEETNEEEVSQEKAAEDEKPILDSLWRGAVGGGVAAVVGGVIWGLITIFTGYRLAIAAWGVGGLAGFAVVFFSGGKKGLPFRLIAVLSCILGIIIAKYFTYFYFTRQYGEIAFLMWFGTIDIFFASLAVATAWIIPKRTKIKV